MGIVRPLTPTKHCTVPWESSPISVFKSKIPSLERLMDQPPRVSYMIAQPELWSMLRLLPERFLPWLADLFILLSMNFQAEEILLDQRVCKQLRAHRNKTLCVLDCLLWCLNQSPQKPSTTICMRNFSGSSRRIDHFLNDWSSGTQQSFIDLNGCKFYPS
jgi:hypothetical protein